MVRLKLRDLSCKPKALRRSNPRKKSVCPTGNGSVRVLCLIQRDSLVFYSQSPYCFIPVESHGTMRRQPSGVRQAALFD